MHLRRSVLFDSVYRRNDLRIIADILATSWRRDPLAPTFDSNDFNNVAQILHASRASALAWWRVRNSALRDCEAAIQCRQAYRLQMLRNTVREGEIAAVFELFRSANIEPILVKGWAIGRHYVEAGLRPYGDIDLLVRPDQLPAAKSLLDAPEMGKYLVDLDHFEFQRAGRRGMDDLFERSQLARLGRTEIRILSAEDHLRYLCLHLLKHGAWRPLWLCDVAVAVESRPAGFDWDLCLRQRARWVECAGVLAHRLLGARLEETPLRRARVPGWLEQTTLAQWERSVPADRQPPESIKTVRSAAHLWEALKKRWPDPITATAVTGGPFNALPRLPFQFAYYFVLASRFLARQGA